MNVSFNPTATTQQHTHSFTPTASSIAQQSGSSSISGSSSESSFFSTALDVITYIPRKIWGLIQMLFCCGQSFADRIASDPKAVAKQDFDKFENAKDLKAAVESWLKDLESFNDKSEDWIKTNAPKVLNYLRELSTLFTLSKRPELQQLPETLNPMIQGFQQKMSQN